MQNNKEKKYAKDDIDIKKRKNDEQIYQEMFRKKAWQAINERYPDTQSKQNFIVRYLTPLNIPIDNGHSIEHNFKLICNIFIKASLEHGLFCSFFDFIESNARFIANLFNERNNTHNALTNYLQNNHGNEINNAIQQAQQNMENRLRDEEARFLNDQRIINNQALQNARNEVNNRANAFFQNQENQIQNQMNQIQNKANQFFNNEYRKYRDVLQQKHQLNKENEKLKAYNATLKKRT